MKIAIASDLHLEFKDISLTNDEGADVLILAGDICVAKHFSSNPKKYEEYQTFFKNCSEQFKHVIYVVGNHEHYNYFYNYTVRDLKESLKNIASNIYLLDKETTEIDGKVFIGSTLWTDMNDECPKTLDACGFFMNDFKVIKHFDGVNYMKFTTKQSVREHVKCRDYIKRVLENSKDKDVVVVSHHSPSHQSIHPKFLHETIINGAFHNSLDYMMEMADNIKLWVHGHTHDSFHYVIGTTQVVCNPRGYPKEYQHDSFKLKYVEI